MEEGTILDNGSRVTMGKNLTAEDKARLAEEDKNARRISINFEEMAAVIAYAKAQGWIE